MEPTTTNGVCTNDDFIRVGTSALANKTIAILNGNNGPNTDDADGTLSMQICGNYLRAKGVKVVGYVHTKTGYPNINGYRSLADVKTDIDTWSSTFNIDGIFVDEVSNMWPVNSYDS